MPLLPDTRAHARGLCRTITWWFAVGGVCTLSACSSPMLTGRQHHDPFIGTPAQNESQAPNACGYSCDVHVPEHPVASDAALTVAADQPGRVTLPNRSSQSTSSRTSANRSGIQLASAEIVAGEMAYDSGFATQQTAFRTEHHPLDVRTTSVYGPADFPDEYLHDGGDRGYPIHYQVDGMHGLETSDTVAEVHDDTGKRTVRASNSVAIYAPRFGSVMTVSSPSDDVVLARLAGSGRTQALGGMREQQGFVQHQDNLEPGRVHTRLRPTGVGTDIMVADVHRGQGTGLNSVLVRLAETRIRIHGAEFNQLSGTQLMEGMQFASEWSRTTSPVLMAHSLAGHETKAVKVLADYTQIGANKGTPGEIILRKIADKQSASIGEEVTFTINYSNTGDRELTSVVILDNLTPRLQYITDSVESERPAYFHVEDNGEGSQVLRFQLEEPLPGKTSGTVRFKCRVK